LNYEFTETDLRIRRFLREVDRHDEEIEKLSGRNDYMITERHNMQLEKEIF